MECPGNQEKVSASSPEGRPLGFASLGFKCWTCEESCVPFCFLLGSSSSFSFSEKFLECYKARTDDSE